MKYYKIKEDIGHKIGDETNKDGINYTVNDVNPETKQVSWKVEYEPDFITIYNTIQKALTEVNELRLELDNGALFNDTMTAIEKAKYAYRKVLKKDFPKAYKKLLQGKIQEISTSSGVGAYQKKNTFYKLKK